MNYYLSSLYYIYALELSNNKWFIYTTKNQNSNEVYLNSKLRYEYISNNLPIISHQQVQITDVLDVNYFVKKYMRLYGIDNVRGGSYSDNILSVNVKTFLQNEIKDSFNNYDQIIDNTIDEFNNISEWSLDRKINTKLELENQQKLYKIEIERFSDLMEPFLKTDQIINRQLIDEYKWFKDVIEMLINDYISSNEDNQNIQDEINEYYVSEQLKNKYTFIKTIILGMNIKFYEINNEDQYLYCTYNKIEDMFKHYDALFLINKNEIDLDYIFKDNYYVMQQIEYILYSLITLTDEYEFDVKSYPENFSIITNWKLNKIESSL
tara:strand:- start:527 stop:1492 length:966 start_codon:yes stop_codon:yes gene_type:complete